MFGIRLKNLTSIKEYNLDQKTISNLEAELINYVTNIFGQDNLESLIKSNKGFEENFSEVRVIDLIADISETISNCIAWINKSEDKHHVIRYFLLHLISIFYKHLVKNPDTHSIDFSDHYTALVGIVYKYAEQMNIDLDWQDTLLEA